MPKEKKLDNIVTSWTCEPTQILGRPSFFLILHFTPIVCTLVFVMNLHKTNMLDLLWHKKHVKTQKIREQ